MQVTLLEHNHSHALKNTQSILRDCVRWALALFRLGEAPMFYHLNPFFVQRLSKVLFCCMLRSPHVQQQQRAAKAALSLCRLCLQRMCRSINHQPRELPLPEVNSRSLTKGPGLIYADAGASTSSQLPQTSNAAAPSVPSARNPKWKSAGHGSTVHTTNTNYSTAAPIFPHTLPAAGDSAMADVALEDDRGAMHARTKSGSAGRGEEDCAMERDGDGEDHAMEVIVQGSEQGGAADREVELGPRRKVWPSSLPDLVSSTSDQTCESMKWLQEWLAYGGSPVRFLHPTKRDVSSSIAQRSTYCKHTCKKHT